MTKIKICGLKRIEDIEYVNEIKPDFVGFVFAGTKRKISDETAAILKEKLDKSIPSVGVFVNDSKEHIAKLANTDIIDMVQLHGDEDSEYITKLRGMTSKTIIKAVRVKDTETIYEAMKLGADYLLLDTYVAGDYGGTGKTFDLAMIPKELDNYFLAGGIGANNIKETLEKCHPYALDLSSSVETDGFKDKEKIREVVSIVRNT